jgi:hypothetical protein
LNRQNLKAFDNKYSNLIFKEIKPRSGATSIAVGETHGKKIIKNQRTTQWFNKYHANLQ